MGFIDKHLLNGEEVIYRTRLHWIIFIKSWLLLGTSLIMLIPGLSILPDKLSKLIPTAIFTFPVQTLIPKYLLDMVTSQTSTFIVSRLDALRLFGALILIFLFFPVWLSVYIRYISSEFGVSNKRVLIKTGFIKRNSFETLLKKVESIGVEQSIVGRILDYGTIVVTGTGGSKEYFYQIKAPIQFRRKVQEQLS